MQYSLNFIIYAARSKPYRQAYGYFLSQIKHEIIRFFCGMTTSTTTTSSHIYFIDRSNPPNPKGVCNCDKVSENLSNGFTPDSTKHEIIAYSRFEQTKILSKCTFEMKKKKAFLIWKCSFLCKHKKFYGSSFSHFLKLVFLLNTFFYYQVTF